MKESKKIVAVLAVVMAAALVSTSNTLADPSQSDITVVGLAESRGGIPHCTLLDGAVLITNSSDTYEYKVWVDGWTENDDCGPTRCEGGQDCTDPEEPCYCDFETTTVVPREDSVVGLSGCEFPVCTDCTTNCDNTTQECSTANYNHCVCTYGVYGATHYREYPSETWLEMPPSFSTAISERLAHPNCPTCEGESACDY
jgi:hypothetical protein